VNRKEVLEQLEKEMLSSWRERMHAHSLKRKVTTSLQRAESESPEGDVIDRLETMLSLLSEATRENVCTNTKCLRYNKKCKMR